MSFLASFLIPFLKEGFTFAILYFEGKVSNFIERKVPSFITRAPSLGNLPETRSIPEALATSKFFKKSYQLLLNLLLQNPHIHFESIYDTLQ